jgi:preprotein translocase subunit YajC
MFNFLFNLLTSASSGTSSGAPAAGNVGCGTEDWIFLGVIVVLFGGMMWWNWKSNKKRQDETKAMLDAIQPGNKVKTIGGICGVVVEICPEDNTFILETGSEVSGKSYIKFDKQAVYQTDAQAKPAETAPVEEAPVEIEEAPVEEAPVTEENTDSVEE